MYLTSPGRPTDIGLQLGKACYPCSRVKGNVFISSFSSLSFLFLFLFLYLSFISTSISFIPSLGDDTKGPTRVDVS